MAGPGRCDVDTPKFRERRAPKTAAMPGANRVSIRSGKPVVFSGEGIWVFGLRLARHITRVIPTLQYDGSRSSMFINAYTLSKR